MIRRGWQVPTRRWSTYPSLTTLTGTFTLDHSDSGNLLHSSGTLFGKSWSWVLGEIFLTLTLTSAPWPRFQMGGCLIDIFFKTFKSWVPWVSLKEWAFSICYFWENSIGGTTPTKFPNFVNVPIIWSWASKMIKIFTDHRNDQNPPRSYKIIKICPLVVPFIFFRDYQKSWQQDKNLSKLSQVDKWVYLQMCGRDFDWEESSPTEVQTFGGDCAYLQSSSSSSSWRL